MMKITFLGVTPPCLCPVIPDLNCNFLVFFSVQARIKTAKRRVVMASLYLGTGPLEQDLVDCMQEALQRSREVDNSDLQVSILLDFTRGSRGRRGSVYVRGKMF